jgi:hypothetical protein
LKRAGATFIEGAQPQADQSHRSDEPEAMPLPVPSDED